jgi:hypothetical protein
VNSPPAPRAGTTRRAAASVSGAPLFEVVVPGVGAEPARPRKSWPEDGRFQAPLYTMPTLALPKPR